MRKYLHIVFIPILLVFTFQQVNTFYQFVHYKLNEEQITMDFCINKDKPEMQCNGKCHLAKKMETEPSYSVEVSKKTKKVPVPQDKLRVQFEILFYSEIQVEMPVNVSSETAFGGNYLNLISEKHSSVLEHPPSAII